MAYVAMPDFNFSNSQSNYSFSNGPSKYRTHRPYNKNHIPNVHRNYENSLGSWDNASSVFPQYGPYRDSQIKMNSDWRNPTRTSRRFAHSVDTAPFSLHQNTYLNSSDISSKYSLGSNKRTSSQPDFQPSIRLTKLKNSKHDHFRFQPCGTSTYHNILGSTSTLNRFSPKRESPVYSDRSYCRQNSKNFRNTSEGPVAIKERQQEMNGKPAQDFLLDDKHQKYSYDDPLENTELRKGDILKNRYQIVQEIGRGSFGNVYKGIDTETGRFCAIKCIKHMLNFKKLADEEISVMEMLSDQDANDVYNFLHLNDHFKTSDHTYMVFDLLSTNLYQLVHRNNYRGFAPKLVRKFVRCILNCLQFLHRNKIIHCDLKPENILLERPGYTNVKVIDFGSSCRVGQNVFTYIQSRFYRAPEVIFGCDYGTPIDIWSLGCIAVELLTGSPVFPGENEQDQIACIMEVLGLPPSSVMRKIRRLRHFFTDEGEPRYVAERNERIEHKGYYKPTRMNRADPGALTLETLLKNSMGEEGSDPQLIDFLSKCLFWDPLERMTAREALQHPWVCETKISNLDNDVTSAKDKSSSSVEE
ncbi:hypothetical protein Aperf_G00000020360 [Anoplocephala perfoliata]